MLQELVKSVIDSFVAPRAAARRVIDNVQDFQGVAVIFGLSFTLSAIVLLLKTFFVGGAAIDSVGGAFPFVLSNLVFSVVMFAVSCAAVYWIGRMFGGEGSPLNVAAVVAWHSLIIVVFLPFLSAQDFASDDGVSIFAIFIVFFTLWIFANFVAEAHRFRSAFKVAAALMVVPIIMIFVLSLTLVVVGTK